MSWSAVPSSSPDWLLPRLRWITAPSWLLSLVAHGLLWTVLLAVSRLPGCQPDAPGEATQEVRAVGVMVRRSAPDPEAVEPNETTTAAVAESTRSATDAVPDRPPVELSLPPLPAPAVIGTGGLPRSVSGIDALLEPRSAAGSASPPSGAGGTSGATTFLGVRDSGKRFVYLIDASSSMADYGALRVAKSELAASLEQLNETQEFQVLFATSARVTALDPGRFGVFRGRDSDRLEVFKQAARVQPDAGTNHFTALEAALRHNPDVIFYLSDGGVPQLTAAELQRISKLNRGARIHAIEFGVGRVSPDPNGEYPPSFLTKLATQNNGRYAYRDVTQLSGR